MAPSTLKPTGAIILIAMIINALLLLLLILLILSLVALSVALAIPKGSMEMIVGVFAMDEWQVAIPLSTWAPTSATPLLPVSMSIYDAVTMYGSIINPPGHQWPYCKNVKNLSSFSSWGYKLEFAGPLSISFYKNAIAW